MLPIPVEVRRAVSVSGIFQPSSHQFVDFGIEVFGHLNVDGFPVPVGFHVESSEGDSSRPYVFGDVSLCLLPSYEEKGLSSGSAGAAVGKAAWAILSSLASCDWLKTVLSRKREATRSWNFDLHGAPRKICDEMLQAIRQPGHIDIYVQLHADCVQRCRFCPNLRSSSSAQDQDGDLQFVRQLAERVVSPALENGVTSTFRFDAYDLSAHPYLAEIMQIVSDSCGCPMHIIVPANRLSVPSVCRTMSSCPGLLSLTTSIFGASAEVHDDVAGRIGAFAETIKAFRNISVLPVSTQCNFVLTSGACEDIGKVADILSHFGIDMNLLSLIADTQMHNELLMPVIPDLAVVRANLEKDAVRILAASRRVNVELTDFPLCIVPASLTHLARSEHSRDSLFNFTLTEECKSCRCSKDCVGVFGIYQNLYGTSGLTACN